MEPGCCEAEPPTGLSVAKRLGRCEVEPGCCEAEPPAGLLIAKRLGRCEVEPDCCEAEPPTGLSVAKRLGKCEVEPGCCEVELGCCETELGCCGAGLGCCEAELNCSLLRLRLIVSGSGSPNKFSGSPSWRPPLLNPGVRAILAGRDPLLGVLPDPCRGDSIRDSSSWRYIFNLGGVISGK